MIGVEEDTNLIHTLLLLFLVDEPIPFAAVTVNVTLAVALIAGLLGLEDIVT
jgi:hypothetical protein